jgi:hypothetical protein
MKRFLAMLPALFLLLVNVAQAETRTATVIYDPVTTFINGETITGEVSYRIVLDGALVAETQDTTVDIIIDDSADSIVCGQTQVVQGGWTDFSDPVCRTLSGSYGDGERRPSPILLHVQRGEPYGQQTPEPEVLNETAQ